MRILAIGTHPDDVEIACSGTLAKCVKRGDTVIVCHASSGNLGHVVIHGVCAVGVFLYYVCQSYHVALFLLNNKIM